MHDECFFLNIIDLSERHHKEEIKDIQPGKNACEVERRNEKTVKEEQVHSNSTRQLSTNY